MTTPEHDQPDHEGLFPASKRRTSKKLRLQSRYCEYKMKALLIPLDRGKGVPSFNEMVAIVLDEVDFDDPTTNVRGHRALAIAKPTLRGY